MDPICDSLRREIAFDSVSVELLLESLVELIGNGGCSVILRKRVRLDATCSVVQTIHVDPKEWGVYAKVPIS
jgi:hypothetical protein